MEILSLSSLVRPYPEIDVTAHLVVLDEARRTLVRQLCPTAEEVLPLAPRQEGLYFQAVQDDRAQDARLRQDFVELRHAVDARALRAAVHLLLVRHRNLRAGFWHVGFDAPVQIVPGRWSTPWREIDLTHLDAAAQDRVLEDFSLADGGIPFDLAAPPLIRVALFRMAADRSVLCLTRHHILADGWSESLLFQELFALYGPRTFHRR